MKFPPTLLALFVAAEHFYIVWLEMTQIPSEEVTGIFKPLYKFMEQKHVQILSNNQGSYSDFLDIELVWPRFAASDDAIYGATILFLSFALTVATWSTFPSGSKGILVKQGLPAILAAATALAV